MKYSYVNPIIELWSQYMILACMLKDFILSAYIFKFANRRYSFYLSPFNRMNGVHLIMSGGTMRFQKFLRVMLMLVIAGAFSVSAQEEGGNPTTGEGASSSGGFDFQGPYDGSGGSQFTMPAGVTTIDGKSYISLRIQPELTLGKFGMGLDVPLLFSTENGKLRTDEFKGGVGPLRMIRYIRYGVKHKDPVYARLGDLTGTTMGYGLIMYNYTNGISFEKRKIGMNVDINYEQQYGFEAVYSDFDRVSIYGVRPYVKPFKQTDIPIIKSTEFGATYMTDRDNKTAIQGMTVMGVDAGITVVDNGFLQIQPYTEFARMLKNDDLADSAASMGKSYGAGQGFALGSNFRFNIIANIFQLGVKLERRIFSSDFMPQYFDAVYEINKDAKAYKVVDAEAVQGNYGEIYANLIGKIQFVGGISIPDNAKKSESAYIHIGMSAPNLIPKVIVSGTYDKGYLDGVADAFRFRSKRSVAHLILGYEAYTMGPFVMQAGIDYKWTFIEKKDKSLKAVNYVMPFVGITTKLPFGDQKK